jgi:hypothetical protein
MNDPMISTAPSSVLPAMRPWVGRIGLTALLSAGMVLAASAFDAPIWVLGVAGALPALPLLAGVTRDSWRIGGGWLALYVVLAATQTAHVGEHVVQVAQLRLLGIPASDAHGVFGALDVEWVHFVWNAWVLLAIGVLLAGRPRSPWLWAAGLLAGWHLAEHTVLIGLYLVTGVEGRPGLLALGGLLGGGVPIARPELHLAYNLVETAPLLIGLAVILVGTWRAPAPVRR